MKNIWTIGLIGPGHRFNKYIPVLLLLFFYSCGISSTSNHNTKFYYDKEIKVRVYEVVEQPPLFNDDIWQRGLSLEFNKRFQYKFQEDESIITTIVAELILDNKGVLVSARLLQNEETGFGKEALKVLRECNKWSPGRVNGKAVYTKLIWKVVY